MELDLPTGSGTTSDPGAAHIDKFLATLTSLVDILGKAGPKGGGQDAGATTGALGAQQGKQLVKATQKLFTDLANSFKPLKTVLAQFSGIHPPQAQAKPIALEGPPPADTATPPLAAQGPPPAAQATPQPAPEQGKPPRKKRQPKGKAEPPEPAPPAPGPVQAPPAQTPGPINAASFTIGQGLLTGSFMLPPDMMQAAGGATEKPLVPGADEGAGLQALTIQDASIGIDQASVKIAQAAQQPQVKPKKQPQQAPATTPAPVQPKAKGSGQGAMSIRAKVAQVKADAARMSIPAASFRITTALLKGSFTLPPGVGTPKAATPPKAGAPKAATPGAPAKVGQTAKGANSKLKTAAQKLQHAIIQIASAVVHVASQGQQQQAQGQAQQPGQQAKPQQAPKGRTARPNLSKGAGKLRGAATVVKAGAASKATAAKAAAGKAGKAAMRDPRTALLMSLAKLANGIQTVAIAIGKVALEAGKQGAKLVGAGVAAPFNALGDTARNVGGRLAAAFTDPLSAFKSLTGTITGFVSVVNPAAVMMFQAAVRDLTAVFGKALAPVMTIATEVVREFANIIEPLIRKLAPVIVTLARAFGDMFIAMSRVYVVMETVLLPVIESMAIIFGGLARIVTAVLEGLTVMIAGFLGGADGLQGVVKSITDAIVDFVKWIVRGTVSLVGMVAKLLGATAFLDNMRKVAKNKGAAERADTTGMAAPTGGNFQAAESFGKSIATASFTATSAATAPKKTDDFLEEMAKDLDIIAETDIKKIIVEAISEALGKVAGNTVQAAGEAAYAYNPLRIPGEALGNMAAWVMGYK